MRLYRFIDWTNEPILCDFDVIKETKCGYWIMDTWRWPVKKRWVTKKGHYAHTTKEIALKSYIERKKYHLAHLKHKTEDAEMMLESAKKIDLSQKLLTFAEDGG